MAPPADRDARRARGAMLPAPADGGADLLRLLAHPNVADKTWVSSQYDHQLFLNTVVEPGADAAVLRLAAPGVPSTGTRGLALSTDGNHRWCALDPRQGTAQTVVESVLNVACAGARPVALVNCLNFGNPEDPVVMWQLSEAIDGMAEACRALSIPVVGGNVSLYNQSGDRNIDPTPVVGVLGLIDELTVRPPGPVVVDGGDVVLLGSPATELAGSLWADVVHGHRDGIIPAPDYRAVSALVQLLIDVVADAPDAGIVGVHDVSEGGLAVALTEMAIKGQVGVDVPAIHGHGEAFSETTGRVLVATRDSGAADALLGRAAAAGVPAEVLGRAGGDRIVIGDVASVPLEQATAAWRDALPNQMSQAAAHE